MPLTQETFNSLMDKNLQPGDVDPKYQGLKWEEIAPPEYMTAYQERIGTEPGRVLKTSGKDFMKSIATTVQGIGTALYNNPMPSPFPESFSQQALEGGLESPAPGAYKQEPMLQALGDVVKSWDTPEYARPKTNSGRICQR